MNDHEHVLRREELNLKEQERGMAVRLKSVLRSTVAITRLFTNRRDQFVGVRSTMKGPD